MNKTIYRGAVVITIDGKIALNSHQFTSWSSPEDKVLFRKLLNESDLIVAGHNTYRVSAKLLDKRNCLIFTRSVKTIKHHKENILFCNPENTDVAKLISKLGYKTIAIIGGAPTLSYFLKKNMLDELHITVEPIVFGGGIPIFENVKIPLRKYKLARVRKLNKSGTLYLHYEKMQDEQTITKIDKTSHFMLINGQTFNRRHHYETTTR